jgi:hypothetical protein
MELLGPMHLIIQIGSVKDFYWFKVYRFMNTIGKPKGVWTTFVSFSGAHAFQGDGPSQVYHHASATWDEPSP